MVKQLKQKRKSVKKKMKNDSLLKKMLNEVTTILKFIMFQTKSEIWKSTTIVH